MSPGGHGKPGPVWKPVELAQGASASPNVSWERGGGQVLRAQLQGQEGGVRLTERTVCHLGPPGVNHRRETARKMGECEESALSRPTWTTARGRAAPPAPVSRPFVLFLLRILSISFATFSIELVVLRDL